MQNKEDVYKKRGGAGAEGVDYQVYFILHVLLKAGLKVKNSEFVSFRLYTELITAGKFDDGVVFYEDKNNKIRSCLTQVKHAVKQSKVVSLNSLTCGDTYNLTMYFDSFKEIIKEEQFKDSLEHLILFTNLKLCKNLLPYVEEVKPRLPIWSCSTVEGNEKEPKLYKLNSQFIDKCQYFQLREWSKVIINYCMKDNELNHTHNNFNDCHELLAREVFDVEQKCFRKEFIEEKSLLPETKIFRDIFGKEIQRIINNDDTPEWLRNQKLKFSKGFGQSSSKTKGSNWPIVYKNDEKELFKVFCDYLILALDQPNEGELYESLTSECVEYFGQLMANEAKRRSADNIRLWLKTPVGSPLTCEFLDDMTKYLAEHEKEFTDLYVRSEITELFNQTIEFDTISLIDNIELFMNAKGKKLLQITTQNSDLSSIKTISCLSKLNHEYLFTSKSKIGELGKAFSRSTCYTVFVWRILDNSTSAFELFLYQLKEILDDIKEKGKKVIVIMNEGQSASGRQLGAPEDWIQRLNDETLFGHLTEDTRKTLLKRNVSFQGCKIEINKILLNDFRLDQVAHDSWGELLSSGNISIGQKVNLSKEYNSNYYIQRSIIQTNTNTGTKQHMNEEEFIQHALPNDQRLSNEGNIRSNCEIFILSDPAGMGKTTVTASLAEKIKRIHPHYWVTRLEAIECVSYLNHFDGTTSDASYDDFFMSKLLKLSSPLERFVFKQYLKNEKSVNKLVLIFDGYDEINEKCQRVVVNLLQYLGRKPNVGFIVITTRTQFQQHLEKHFQRKACILRPFDEKNKIEILQKYWTSRGIRENNNRITEYAKQLIKCISSSITEEASQLTGIPLQMIMIAVIRAEDARSYVQNEEKDLCLSTMSLGLFDLYEKFIQIKEKICLEDKMKDTGLAFNTKMIKSVQQHQAKFAREIILERPDVPKMQVTDLELTTQLGIIQKNPEGEFSFTHRTFPEFLTAKFLLEEFIENDSVPVADKIKNGLLIDKIKKSNLYVIRKFLNCRLNSAKLAEECKKSKDKSKIQRLLIVNCKAIIVTSAEEENLEFIKLTIEFNAWRLPENMYFVLQSSLWQVKKNSKHLTAILNCMLEKWLPAKDVILMKTIDFLIRKILVNKRNNLYDRSELIKSTIDFQNELERAGVFTEEELRNILSKARDKVVNRSKYWNWRSLEYFKHLHSTHKNLFLYFFKDNRTLLQRIRVGFYNYNVRDLLPLILSYEELNANWVFDDLIEHKFVDFGDWTDENFKLYFSILHSSAGQFNSERKEKLRNYLEEVIQLLHRQYDLSWKGLFEKFLMDYETIIFPKECVSKFDKTKTIEDLEYCALWGQTNKLKEILEVGDIETAAVERFQLAGGTLNLAATRSRILISIRERQGEDVFLQWIGQRNWRNRTILQHALLKKDDLNIKLISNWIKTERIFETIMRMDYVTIYHASEYEIFLDFVNERFPQYRLRFLQMNKNDYVLHSRATIFRMIENGGNMSKIEFVQILKLQLDVHGFKGETILHRVLFIDDIGILQKWLNLMNKFSLDSETISQLFRIRNVTNRSPLVFIQYDNNYARRQKKKKICVEFLNEKMEMKWKWKEEIENLEEQAHSGPKINWLLKCCFHTY